MQHIATRMKVANEFKASPSVFMFLTTQKEGPTTNRFKTEEREHDLSYSGM